MPPSILGEDPYSTFKDFWSISIPTFMDFWETKPVEHPINQVSCHFKCTIQYEGKGATNHLS